MEKIVFGVIVAILVLAAVYVATNCHDLGFVKFCT